MRQTLGSLAPDSSIRSKIFILVPSGTMLLLARQDSVFILADLYGREISVPIGTKERVPVLIRTKTE
jgi:hypothetical protein